MRNLCFVVATLLILPGCTTISLVPVSTMIETQISGRHSPKIGVIAYIAQARDRHWVRNDRGIWGSMRAFLQSSEERVHPYLVWVTESQHEWQNPVHTVTTDIELAATGLDTITGQVEAILAIGERPETLPSDLTKFENALMVAQESRLGFVEALDYLTVNHPDFSAHDAQGKTALGTLDKAINSAKMAADRLAIACRTLD